MLSFLLPITQIVALIRKELLALLKEPASRVILVTPALIQALLFGYAATYDLTYVPYAVLDQSQSTASQTLLSRLDSTGVFVRVATLSSSQEFSSYIDAEKALLVIHIPSDFQKQLNSNKTAPLHLILDGRNSSTAGAAANYIGAIVNDYNLELMDKIATITIIKRAWFNPNLESRWNLMSGLIAALSMLQTLLISALSVAREREQGTFEQLLITPLTPMHILIGKALPAIFIGLLQSTIIFLIILFWFNIPMVGSIGLFYFGLITFTIASVGIGLSISALSLTMQQAMLYTFLLIMPLMLLSGLLTPINNMPEILQTITYINPLRFGINIIRRVYLEGVEFIDIWQEFIPLFLIAITTLPLSAWLFRHGLS